MSFKVFKCFMCDGIFGLKEALIEQSTLICCLCNHILKYTAINLPKLFKKELKRIKKKGKKALLNRVYELNNLEALARGLSNERKGS